MLAAIILAAVLAQTPGTHAYHVQFRPRLEAFGFTGELTLTLSDKGYVNGTYRADSGGTLKPVHGGYRGDQIWFDVPTLGGLHVEATMKNEAMSGVAAPTGTSTRQYIFTATPEASP
jgi:hypothetical protein